MHTQILVHRWQRSSQFFQAGDHVDHLRGHQDHVLIFSFYLTYTSHQEAFFVASLTKDPSLIWNTEIRAQNKDFGTVLQMDLTRVSFICSVG